MPVTLGERTWFTIEYGRRARRDHDFDVIAVRGDRVVGGRAIIRAVSRYPGDRAINLIEQRRNLRRIIGVLIRRTSGHKGRRGSSVDWCERSKIDLPVCPLHARQVH